MAYGGLPKITNGSLLLLLEDFCFRADSIRENPSEESSGLVFFICFLGNSRMGEMEGIETHFASLDDLIRMKQAAGRDKDLQDLKILKRLKNKNNR